MTQNGYCVHGLVIDLLSVMTAPRMSNISFNLWHTTSTATGGYDNLVKEVLNPGTLNVSICGSLPCDMAIGDITVNWPRRRMQNSRFAFPMMSIGLQIVARIQQQSYWSASFAFLDPFHWSLWLATSLSLGFITLVVIFLEAAHFKSLLRGQSGRFAVKGGMSWRQKSIALNLTWPEALWFVSQTIFSTQDNSIVKTKASRIIIWLWMALVLLLIASYTASLTAFLTSNGNLLSLKGLAAGPFAADSLREAVAQCPQCLVTQKGGNTELILGGTLQVCSHKLTLKLKHGREQFLRYLKGTNIPPAHYTHCLMPP